MDTVTKKRPLLTLSPTTPQKKIQFSKKINLEPLQQILEKNSFLFKETNLENHLREIKKEIKLILEPEKQSDYIGKITYLADYQPNLYYSLFIEKTKNLSMEKELHSILLSKQTKISEQVNIFKTVLEKEAPIYEQKLVAQNLADCLVTTYGKINTFFIPYLSSFFLPQQTTLFEQKKSNLLEKIRTQSDLRSQIEAFAEIEIPSLETINLFKIISLDYSSPLTPKDLVKSILTALLSPHHQRSTGHCFIHGFIRILLEDHPKEIISILRSLFIESKLNIFKIALPMIMESAKETILNSFLIKKTGFALTLSMKPFNLSTFPSFLRMTRLYKAFSSENFIQIFTEKIFKNIGLHISAAKTDFKTVMDVIIQLEKESILKNHLIFAFETTSLNPLLLTLDFTLAGLSMIKKADLIFSNLQKSLKTSFSLPVKTENKTIPMEEVIEKVFKFYHKRTRYIYSPDMSNKKDYLFSKNMKGSFVLFDTQHQLDFKNWLRISSSQDFLFLLHKIQKEMEITNTITKEESLALKNLFNNKSSIKDLIINFQPLYNKTIQTIKTFDHLRSTPWNYMNGGVNKNIFKSYFDNSIQIYQYKRTLDINIPILSELIYDMQKILKKSDSVYINCNFIGGEHTCFLNKYCDYFLKTREMNLEEIQKFIEKNILHTTTEVIHKLIEKHTSDKIAGYASAFTNNPQAFLKEAQNIDVKGISYKGYYTQLKQLLIQHQKNPTAFQNIDRHFFKVLSQKFPEWDKKNYLSLFNSNWAEEKNDVLLSFRYHPFSKKFELWKVNENGEDSALLDPKKWMENKELSILYTY